MAADQPVLDAEVDIDAVVQYIENDRHRFWCQTLYANVEFYVYSEGRRQAKRMYSLFWASCPLDTELN